MINSMTGYGSATGTGGGAGFTVEIKSVNSRYLDVSVHMPRSMLFAEDEIKTAVSGKISRGKADIFVSLDHAGVTDTTVRVNESLLREYASAIGDIAAALGIESGLTAADAARFPDIITVVRIETNKEELQRGLLEALNCALEGHAVMRRREGQRLDADIRARLDEIERLTEAVRERSPEVLAEYRARLERRMRELIQGAEVDESRLLTECAVYADRTAVDEETVRLLSHVSQMRLLLDEGSPVGRKLDFLVQELGREANTIGAKSADSAMTASVLGIKAEIEKIREQAQNIE